MVQASRLPSAAETAAPQNAKPFPDGRFEPVESCGLPFGMMDDASYDEVTAQLGPEDCLLLFSDGAVEIHNADGEMLGVDGLVGILKESGYPRSGIKVDAVEDALLKFSNAIRLEDDLTFLEARLR